MTEQELVKMPENVVSLTDPNNGNMIWVTTFDSESVDNEFMTEGYRNSLEKVIVQSEYQFFKDIKESSNLKEGKMNFSIPHVVVNPSDVPEGIWMMAKDRCETYGDNTKVLMRFFECDVVDGQAFYTPVLVEVKNGHLVQAEEENDD